MGKIVFVDDGTGVITATGMASGLTVERNAGDFFFSLLYKGNPADGPSSARSKPAGKAHVDGPCEPGRPTTVGNWGSIVNGVGTLGPDVVDSSNALVEYQTVSIRLGTRDRGDNILVACGQLAISYGHAPTE